MSVRGEFHTHHTRFGPLRARPGLDNSTGNSTATRQATRQVARQLLDRTPLTPCDGGVKCQARQLDSSTDLIRHDKPRLPFSYEEETGLLSPHGPRTFHAKRRKVAKWRLKVAKWRRRSGYEYVRSSDAASDGTLPPRCAADDRASQRAQRAAAAGCPGPLPPEFPRDAGSQGGHAMDPQTHPNAFG